MKKLMNLLSQKLFWLFILTAFALASCQSTKGFGKTANGDLKCRYSTVANGAWTDPMVWENGFLPPNPLPQTQTILIKHDLTLDEDVVVEGTLEVNPAGKLAGSFRPLEIAPTGMLTNAGYIEAGFFRNWGSLENKGTLVMRGIRNMFGGSIKSCGTIESDGQFMNAGYICGEGGQFRIAMGYYFQNLATGFMECETNICSINDETDPLGTMKGYVDWTEVKICGQEYTPPIDFLYFQAGIKGKKQVDLEWGTSLECCNTLFSIERKGPNDDRFKVIDRMAGTGSRKTFSTYDYKDRIKGKGAWQYRIRQMDDTGKDLYTRVIQMEVNAQKVEFTSYPNPGRGKVELNVYPYLHHPVSIEAVNERAQTVFKAKFPDLSEGKIALDFSHLPVGVYFLKLESGKNAEIQRVVIQ